MAQPGSERKGGLRTQVAPLCPLPPYRGPDPPRSPCLTWLGLPEPFSPPWHCAPPAVRELGDLNSGVHCQPGAELCLWDCAFLFKGLGPPESMPPLPFCQSLRILGVCGPSWQVLQKKKQERD